MGNFPVQIVMNASEYEKDEKRPPGHGNRRDYYAGKDDEYRMHRARFTEQLTLFAAAQQENWQWLSTYAEQISLEHCADEIAITAYRAEARVLAQQIARHSMNEDQRVKLADVVVEAGDFEFLQQLADILSPEYFGGVLVAAAQNRQWDHVDMFVGSADQDSIEKMMELAIAEGNFDAIDMLDEHL